jgi:hypothetical protein
MSEMKAVRLETGKEKRDVMISGLGICFFRFSSMYI